MIGESIPFNTPLIPYLNESLFAKGFSTLPATTQTKLKNMLLTQLSYIAEICLQKEFETFIEGNVTKDYECFINHASNIIFQNYIGN